MFVLWLDKDKLEFLRERRLCIDGAVGRGVMGGKVELGDCLPVQIVDEGVVGRDG